MIEQIPAQHQTRQPGIQSLMTPLPVAIRDNYRGSEKLKNKVALISGGDSGIGQAVAIHFAREGASVAILYKDEHADAEATVALIESEGQDALAVAGDIGNKRFCAQAVEKVVKTLGPIDILVNNAAEQHVQKSLTDIPEEQLRQTFQTNIFGYFFLTQSALPHLREGGVIINTGSVTSFEGKPELIDYSATKGAIQAFTLSMAKALGPQKIRVNEVAPGPIWTPLIPASFSAEQVHEFGQNTLLGRPGQPAEVAPAYVFLASEDASFITGQIIHVNGGGHFGV
ncbi:MAG: SDR family oxidoreductase [Spongiibacteraceae bacterium]